MGIYKTRESLCAWRLFSGLKALHNLPGEAEVYKCNVAISITHLKLFWMSVRVKATCCFEKRERQECYKSLHSYILHTIHTFPT